MSWRVEVLKNNIKISDECAEELWNYNEKEELNLWNEEEVVDNGFLYFDPELEAWIDYLSDYKEIIEILKKHNSEGKVYFGSLDVPEGCFWGHDFDRKGGYKRLKGILSFIEEGVE